MALMLDFVGGHYIFGHTIASASRSRAAAARREYVGRHNSRHWPLEFFCLQPAVGQAAPNWRSPGADDVLDSEVLIGEQVDPDVADSFMRD
jgi:hypothetical protein